MLLGSWKGWAGSPPGYATAPALVAPGERSPRSPRSLWSHSYISSYTCYIHATYILHHVYILLPDRGSNWWSRICMNLHVWCSEMHFENPLRVFLWLSQGLEASGCCLSWPWLVDCLLQSCYWYNASSSHIEIVEYRLHDNEGYIVTSLAKAAIDSSNFQPTPKTAACSLPLQVPATARRQMIFH